MNRRSLAFMLAGGMIVVFFIWWALQGFDLNQEQGSTASTQPTAESALQLQGEIPPDQLSVIRLPKTPANSKEPIEAQALGSLSGQLILADEAAVDRFSWTVRLEGPAYSWPINTLSMNADGTFSAEGLQAGTYDVLVERGGLSLGIVNQVIVISGQETKDPRLNPWRPEESSREMRLRISGRPGRRGDTNVWAVRGEGEILGHARWEGEERILQTPAGYAHDVIVIAPGYQPQRIPWQDGVVEITLERGLQIELQAVLPVEFGAGIKRGWCALVPEFPLLGINSNQFAVSFSAKDLAAGKIVPLRVPAAGSYELRFDADSNDGPGFMPLYLTVLQRGILVQAQDGVPKIDIVLPNPLQVEAN